MKLRFHLRDLFFVTTLLSVVLAYLVYYHAWFVRRQHYAQLIYESGAIYGPMVPNFKPAGPGVLGPRAFHPLQPATDIIVGEYHESMNPIDLMPRSRGGSGNYTPPTEAELMTAVKVFGETQSLQLTGWRTAKTQTPGTRQTKAISAPWGATIAGLGHLEHIALVADEVDPAVLSAVAKWKKLKDLHLQVAVLPREFFTELGNHATLESLTLNVDAPEVDAETLMTLAKIPTLKKLTLSTLDFQMTAFTGRLSDRVVGAFRQARPDVEIGVYFKSYTAAPHHAAKTSRPPSWLSRYFPRADLVWLGCGVLAAAGAYALFRNRRFMRSQQSSVSSAV